MSNQVTPEMVNIMRTNTWSEDSELPCDVTLGHGVTIKAGCKFGTLLAALTNQKRYKEELNFDYNKVLSEDEAYQVWLDNMNDAVTEAQMDQMAEYYGEDKYPEVRNDNS